MITPPTISDALAKAEELTEADYRLRVISRGGQLPDAAELQSLCWRVARLVREWEALIVRLQIHSN